MSVVYKETLPSFLAPSTSSFWRSADFIKATSSTVAAPQVWVKRSALNIAATSRLIVVI